MIDSLYYGDKKKPKNPFRNCINSKEIYNLHRKI